MSPRRRCAAALVAVALVLAACGGDDAGEGGAADPAGDSSESEAPPATAGTTAEVAPDSEPAEGSAADLSTDSDVERQDVRFTTPDGETLEGTVYGSGDIGIVLAHMRGRDRTTWRPFAEAAAAAGYRALAFDFRGYGGSTGERDTALDVDLIAAVEFLRGQGTTNTVVMGASMGGTATVNVAARLELSAAVSLSAPGNFLGLPATDIAGDIAEPVLVIAAEDDEPYATDAAAIDAAAPASRLEILPGRAHGTNLFADHDPALTALLLEFVGARVG